MDNNQLQVSIAKRQAMKVSGKPNKIGDYHCGITSVSYDPEGKYIAIGAYDGSIKLFNALSGKPHTVLNSALVGPDDDVIPMTCVRWRPTYTQGQLKPSSIIASATSNGLIQHWSLSTNKAMSSSEITRHRDNNCNINIMDYTCDGKKLLVAGEDRNIHVYDDQTCQLITSMHAKGFQVPGHQNRVFGLRCHPENFNIVVSGGWDGSLKLYDLREGSPIASIGGPQISGDSIDIFDDMIVTGSTRNKDVMQMFSLSQMKLIHSWDFNPSSKEIDSGYVLSTRFSNDGNFIFAGGAGKNDLRVYMNNCDTSASYKLQMEIKELPSAIFTIDVNPNPDIKQFVFGCSNGSVMTVNYDFDTKNSEFEPYQGNFQKIAYDHIAQEDYLKKQKKQVYQPTQARRMDQFNI